MSGKKRKLQSHNTSGYTGVRKRGKRFQAQITAGGKRHNLGSYKTAKAAALAYDRAVVQHKRPASKLNYPDGLPIDDEDYDELMDPNKNKKFAAAKSSGFHGVVQKGKRFYAKIYLGNSQKSLGGYDTAKEAALAYDRAVVHHKRPASLMNYPDGLPIDDEDYEAIMNPKMTRSLYSNNTTGYRGVYKIGKKFAARVKIGRTVKSLGLYDTPKEAAVAYDQAVVQLKLPSIRLNFPNDYDYTSSSDEKSGESSSSESCQSEYSVGQFVSCMYNKQWSTVQITGVCADFTYNIQWEEFDDDNDYNVNEKELRLIVTSEEEEDDDDL
jgi:hypothetical protein